MDNTVQTDTLLDLIKRKEAISKAKNRLYKQERLLEDIIDKVPAGTYLCTKDKKTYVLTKGWRSFDVREVNNT
jgi:hypothetical protein